MLISHRYRFIFIHIFKTGGSSVRTILVPYSRLIDRMAYEYKVTRKLYGSIVRVMNWHDDGMRQFTGFHKHEGAHSAQIKLRPDVFDTYFKFAFVRNPFDWVVSLYSYIAGSEDHKDHAMVVRMDFNEFVTWFVDQEPLRQSDFVTSPESGDLLVDYVGRLESLSEDLDAICMRIGVEDAAYVPHVNPSRERVHASYAAYYDRASRSTIASYFQEDLQRFGYAYEDGEGP